MLKNAENIALHNLPILYTFVLQVEIRTTFGDGFCFSCFNKNLAKHWNCPLIVCN